MLATQLIGKRYLLLASDPSVCCKQMRSSTEYDSDNLVTNRVSSVSVAITVLTSFSNCFLAK